MRRPQPTVGQVAQMEMDMLDANQYAREAQEAAPKKITEESIREATQILNKYKGGKAQLEKKIIANEEFWKLRQWNFMNDGKADFKPATAWLWSCIQSRHADAMDGYPTCNFRPRQEDDKQEAAILSDVVPIIMEQNRYEDTYSDIVWYTLKQGGSVQGVFWDGRKNNGLGDVSVRKIDIINFFWEPGITDIQESKNVFTTELMPNDKIEQIYPETKGKLGQKGITLAKYLYDENYDTSNCSVIVDWYYHTYYNGEKRLQYVKYVNDIILYATENEVQQPTRQEMDPATGIPLEIPVGRPMAEAGLYDHAMYPFVCMALYPIEGSIFGYGLTDIGRDCQLEIDRLNKAITDNAIVGATPRYFIRNDGSVNERELADISNPFIHVEGQIGEENIRPVDYQSLGPHYLNVLESKINEIKYVTANQDVNNGHTSQGVTAASAIAALQETAGKAARDANMNFYRAYREVIYQVVELVRQFYDAPRTFRLAPDSMGNEEFVQFDNSGLVPQPQMMQGIQQGFRLPEFDIYISAEKDGPYKKMEQNELALQFYNLGFFNPQMADQAAACVSMMDFKEKDDLLKKIQANGMMYEALLQYQKLALQLAQQVDPALADQIGQAILQAGGGAPVASPMSDAKVDLDGSEGGGMVGRARDQARESTQI